jgi:GT2 family glycosyltransferase
VAGRYDRAAIAAATGRQRICAVVLNYRTPDDTVLAVQSLLASNRRADEIVVVDNDVVESAGTDGTVRIRRHTSTQARTGVFPAA